MLEKRSTSRRVATGAASLGAGVALLASAFAGTAGADNDDSEWVRGNPKCADLGYDNGFKIEAQGELPSSGTYSVGDEGTEAEGNAAGFVVAIDINAGNPAAVVFDANTPVDAVLVKAGPGGKLYTYEPPVMSGQGLESKKDSISHITFCWDGDTPPGEEPGPTTTVPGDEEPGPTTTVPAGEPGEDGGAPPAQPVAGSPSFTG